MRDSTRRDVTFLDLIIGSHPQHAPIRSLTYYVDRIAQLYQNGRTEQWHRNRSQKLYIRDLERDPAGTYILFLLYYNNGNASPAAYCHLDTDQQRIEAPQAREGRPESAHLLIDLTAANNSQAIHLTLLEDSAKINRRMVESYFNYLIRTIKSIDPTSFTAPHPDGSRLPNGNLREYKFSNKVVLQGHPSNDFQTMLEDGKLTGISLETARQQHFVIADGSYVTPVKNELKLQTVSGKWHENARLRLNEALSFGRTGRYENARITFIAPDTKSHTVHLDTDTGNIIGDSFIKKVRLSDFTQLLNEADEAINPEIRTKMLAIR